MEQRWMSQRFFLFFFTWGVFVPYFTLWLNDHGLTIEQAGTVISISLIVRGLSQLFLFPYFSARTTVIKLQFWIPFISFGLLLLFPLSSSFAYLAIAMTLFSLVYPTQLPLNETSGSLLTRLPNFDYGKSRQFGSLGFVVALSVMGVLIDQFGTGSILVMLAVGSFILALHARLQAPEVFIATGKSASLSEWKTLFKNKQFLIVLTVVTLISGSHAIYNTFAAPYAETLGAPKSWIGFILTIAVIAEIACFMFAQKLFGNFQTKTLLAIGALTSALRWGLTALVPTLFVFIIMQLLHSISFALVHLAFIWYTAKHIPAKLIPSAQGMYAAFGMSFAAGVITLVTSGIYASSPSTAYFIMSGIALIAFFILIVGYKSKGNPPSL